MQISQVTHKQTPAPWAWARLRSAAQIQAGLSRSRLPTLGPTPSQDACSSCLTSWGSSPETLPRSWGPWGLLSLKHSSITLSATHWDFWLS